MQGQELVKAILVAHQNGISFEPYPEVAIRPQTGYQGVVAITAYRGWRAKSHLGRPKVGLFDIRISVEGEDLEHERSVILPSVSTLAPTMAEAVFDGEAPEKTSADSRQRLVMATLQAESQTSRVPSPQIGRAHV